MENLNLSEFIGLDAGKALAKARFLNYQKITIFIDVDPEKIKPRFYFSLVQLLIIVRSKADFIACAFKPDPRNVSTIEVYFRSPIIFLLVGVSDEISFRELSREECIQCRRKWIELHNTIRINADDEILRKDINELSRGSNSIFPSNRNANLYSGLMYRGGFIRSNQEIAGRLKPRSHFLLIFCNSSCEARPKMTSPRFGLSR